MADKKRVRFAIQDEFLSKHKTAGFKAENLADNVVVAVDACETKTLDLIHLINLRLEQLKILKTDTLERERRADEKTRKVAETKKQNKMLKRELENRQESTQRMKNACDVMVMHKQHMLTKVADLRAKLDKKKAKFQAIAEQLENRRVDYEQKYMNLPWAVQMKETYNEREQLAKTISEKQAAIEEKCQQFTQLQKEMATMRGAKEKWIKVCVQFAYNMVQYYRLSKKLCEATETASFLRDKRGQRQEYFQGSNTADTISSRACREKQNAPLQHPQSNERSITSPMAQDGTFPSSDNHTNLSKDPNSGKVHQEENQGLISHPESPPDSQAFPVPDGNQRPQFKTPASPFIAPSHAMPPPATTPQRKAAEQAHFSGDFTILDPPESPMQRSPFPVRSTTPAVVVESQTQPDTDFNGDFNLMAFGSEGTPQDGDADADNMEFQFNFGGFGSETNSVAGDTQGDSSFRFFF